MINRTYAFPVFVMVAFPLLFTEVLAEAKHIERSLAPGGIHEDCLDLKSGQKLSYAFMTEAPVDFNIHFHAGKNVIYPVKRQKTKSEKETFKASEKQTYCLMWTNSSKHPTSLKYEFARQRPF